MTSDDGLTGRELIEAVPPVSRRGAAAIAAEAAVIARSDLVKALMETSEGLLAVLDGARQIIAVNDGLLRSMGLGSAEEALGLRLGEALSCAHSAEGPDGCGTSEACAACGAVIAVVGCMAESKAIESLCSLRAGQDGSAREFLLKVRAVPLSLDSGEYVLLYVRDETENERRAALERVFFHDVSNVVTALSSAAFLAGIADGDRRSSALKDLNRLSQRLVREIALQRVLLRGGAGEWKGDEEEIEDEPLMRELEDFGKHHPAGAGKSIETRIGRKETIVRTDYAFLLRVLSNMLVNALEASAHGDSVRIEADESDDAVRYSVWNAQAMPEAARQRVFERHFSTKGGKGRGIGTYSMKLLGETYLGGRVGFETGPLIGTRFWIELPRGTRKT